METNGNMSDIILITGARRAAQGASAADIARGEIGGEGYNSDMTFTSPMRIG